MNPLIQSADQVTLFHIPWLHEGNEDIESLDLRIAQSSSRYVDIMKNAGWQPSVTSGIEYFEFVRCRMASLCIGGRAFKDYFPTEITPCQVDAEAQYDINLFFSNAISRRLAVLSTGHFALVPITIEPEDVVFVISGCSMPVALRPCAAAKDTFTVVGECYVEGFMTGEAMTAVNTGESTLESITLC